jgi:predicted PurR-regulated permease PerM
MRSRNRIEMSKGAPQRPEPPPQAPKDTLPMHASARMATRAAFALLLLAVAILTARHFLAALGWAVVLAITIWPLYARFTARASADDPPVLAPLLFTIATGIILFIPLALAAQQLGSESERIMQFVGQLRENGIPTPGWLGQLPIAGEQAANWWRLNLADPAAASSWLQGVNQHEISAWVKAFGGQLLDRVFLFFISLIALFVLLRNGAWLAARALDTADRLLGDPGERLASKMVDAIRGTVLGTVVVAVAEGLLIGIAYFLAGVPNALLFMFLTMAFAMLPLGAWIAFTAASLLLVAQGGSPLAGVFVFGFGAIVMLIGDHFVWPNLVGGTARLPFLFALIGIFGGLEVFGLIGLFLGPVIMAALITIWREWVVGASAVHGPVPRAKKPR